MTTKNIILTIVTFIVFAIGCWRMYVSISMVAVFAILLALYATLQSAIEAADFKEPRRKEVFLFIAKTVVTVITCLAAIHTQS
ncbi:MULTISPECIES: hypothetical protein [Leclercia]|jgi:hypothetical protein|uniref:hypothetical protein n=1 Tax=Leclercia TaxID=83654 RepID=UPI002B2BABAD|nr:hypothetical protein NRF19_22430 [Leclercia adecarboxylata]